MAGREAPRALRILYGVVIAAVAVFGLVTIVDYAQRGDELPGGSDRVTGRVVEERPGFAGALAIVEVAYEAGGRERTARIFVAGSNQHPTEPTYHPGDRIDLLVSRTKPDRVQQVGWNSDTPTTAIPPWLLVLAAAGLIAPLVLPKPRRRLQEAIGRSFR
jgi:hypothetical protein